MDGILGDGTPLPARLNRQTTDNRDRDTPRRCVHHNGLLGCRLLEFLKSGRAENDSEMGLVVSAWEKFGEVVEGAEPTCKLNKVQAVQAVPTQRHNKSLSCTEVFAQTLVPSLGEFDEAEKRLQQQVLPQAPTGSHRVLLEPQGRDFSMCSGATVARPLVRMRSTGCPVVMLVIIVTLVMLVMPGSQSKKELRSRLGWTNMRGATGATGHSQSDISAPPLLHMYMYNQLLPPPPPSPVLDPSGLLVLPLAVQLVIRDEAHTTCPLCAYRIVCKCYHMIDSISSHCGCQWLLCLFLWPNTPSATSCSAVAPYYTHR